MSELSRRIAELSPEKRAKLLQKLKEQGGPTGGRPRIGRQPRPPEGAPLSLAQRRLWLFEQIDPGTATFAVPYVLAFSGPLDVAALGRGLGALAARHETLRTTFHEAGGQPVQRVAEAVPDVLEREDLSGEPDPEAAAWRRVRAEAARPFDLAVRPLWRCRLFRVGPSRHLLLLVAHHIVIDGWSLRRLFAELAAGYRAFTAGEAESGLPELEVQFADFAIWQQNLPEDERASQERDLEYWKQRLAGARGVLEVPADFPRPLEQSLRGARLARLLPPALTRAARSFALSQGLTVFAVYLAAFAAYLHRLTGERDLLVGSPFAGRGREEIDPLVGFFVNTLPLRVTIDGEPTLRELARQAQQATLDADAHQEMPFERLIEELRPPRDLARPPLFQVMFTLQADWPPELDFGGVAVAVDAVDSGTSKYDLTLFVSDREERTELCFEYASELFLPETVARMAGHLETLLAAALARPDAPLGRLPLLTAGERAELAAEAAAGRLAYQPEEGAWELFAAQAAREPARIALRWQGQSLDYGTLAARAGRLAAHLRGRGVGPEVRVGVLCRREPDLLVALLGVLGAAGAYVPLDPAYPAERLAYMLADSGCELLLTQEALLPILPAGFAGGVLCLDRDAVLLSAGEPLATSPAPASRLSHLIYTSGSTGRPKGVAIPVASVAAFIAWARTVFTDEELASVLAATSVCFDLSVFELFVTLAAGGTVVLVDNALELATAPDRERVKLINTVPSAMAELVRMGALPPSVATVNLAGEPLKNRLAQAIYGGAAVERVYDLYGPSEDTTYSTFSLVARGATSEPVIGRAIANSRVVLADRRGEVLPAGVPGELLLGGDGLARGYLGRPALTAEKFVPDTLASEAGARLYRTGDLARRRHDGELEYLGRIDHQVKIRGFRIELGEIEVVLAAHPAVREATVTALAPPDGAGDGEALRLVAYLSLKPGELAGPGELRDHLRTRLPDHMVPSAFVFLDTLPLTPNGKVDRKALPAPDWARPDVAQEYLAPRTAEEQELAALWAEVLKVERVGVKDNFFFLGGHSLLATQVVSRIAATFGVQLAARDLFRAPTVEGLATTVVQAVAHLAGDADLEALLAQLEGLDDDEPGSAPGMKLAGTA